MNAFNHNTFALTDLALPARLPKADELIARHDKHTREITALFRIVPTKDRPASYYTAMALRRRGAFGEKGKGFHDTIVLTGILEDMAERNYTHAIIVSKDGGFRLDGVRDLANESKVRLTILESIAALEKQVKEELDKKMVREMEAAKQRVIAMVKSCQSQLNDFLAKALDYTRDPLGPMFDTVGRREFLGFVDYVDAHASEILLPLGPCKDFKFSVDVRAKVRERTDEFRATELLPSLNFGFNSIHPENILTKTVEREMSVTVEGEADISENAVATIRFTSIRDTKGGDGFASFLANG